MMEKVMLPIDREKEAAVEREMRIRTFVGPRADIYMQKWNRIHLKRRSIGWNWAGALFGMYWLAYRKMYLLSTAYMLSLMAMGYLLYNKDLLTILALLFNVLIGGFGDKLYQSHVYRNLSSATEKGVPVEYQTTWLQRKGGVRWINILFPTLVAFLFSFTLSGLNRLAPPPVNEASTVAAQGWASSEDRVSDKVNGKSGPLSYLNVKGSTIQALLDTYQAYGVQDKPAQSPAFKKMESKDAAFSIALVGNDINHLSSGFINFFVASDEALTYTGLTLQTLFLNEADPSDDRNWAQAAAWVGSRIDAFNKGDNSSQEITIEGTKLGMVVLDNSFALLTFSPQE